MAADSAISYVIELLGKLLIEKVKFLQGVEEQVKLLKEELMRMQSFLKYANKKEDGMARDWISSIREVAQNAQDTLEIFLLNVESGKDGGLLETCSAFPKRMYHLNKIGHEIESIKKSLDLIDQSRERYGIKLLGEAAESASRLHVESLRRLCPWQNDEHLVGVEDDVKKLLQESILYEEKKGLSVAVLEGFGGIGKTTLAREIFNHPDVVAGPFDHRGWVVVSSEFTLEETIKQLLLQLETSEEGKLKLIENLKKMEKSMKDKLFLREEFKRMLHMNLEGKSYFVVLDDVWQTEHLESLITAFPNEQDKSSRLMVTTRHNVHTKHDKYVHKMKPLDPDKSWQLLLKKSFIGTTYSKCPEELEGTGRQILEKCHGLPLTINMVGGLLLETQTKSGWEQVLNKISYHLGRAENNVLPIIELSYHNLSPQLKSCFLCLSTFKEDYDIPAEWLLNIWVAQGLIQQEGSSTINEIARGYLNELINRNMLEVQDRTIDGRAKKCRLHDLLRDVCLRKAKEEIGLEIVKWEGTSSESSYVPRHRVVYGEIPKTSRSRQNKHIRSLFLLGNPDLHMTTRSHYWKSYQILKTLDIDGFNFHILPNCFRFLIGLKCLRIYQSHVTSFYLCLDLPSWLDHLKNLEVLHIELQLAAFRSSFTLKMEKLRIFRARAIYCNQTKINIWKNLECLKYVKHNDWLRYKPDLTSGCRLRELGICFESQIEPQEFIKVRESLEEMQNLVILRLWLWRDDTSDLALAMPQLLNLTGLKLKGTLLKCPTASMFPPYLSQLTLAGTSLNDDPMVELGKLPNLSFLKLQYNPYLGETMHFLCDGFPSLEGLSLRYLEELKGIIVEEGGMPQLKHLQIHGCPKLETRNLPEHINISA